MPFAKKYQKECENRHPVQLLDCSEFPFLVGSVGRLGFGYGNGIYSIKVAFQNEMYEVELKTSQFCLTDQVPEEGWDLSPFYTNFMERMI